jgi:hypothetical protein
MKPWLTIAIMLAIGYLLGAKFPMLASKIGLI